MATVLKPVAHNERSKNVQLLHKALEALGSPVARGEVDRGEAGRDTRRKLHALQARLNLSVDDSVAEGGSDAMLLDETTALAIENALNGRDPGAEGRRFSVTGAVRLRGGTVKKRQPLLAFDLDLRGVAIYRRIKNLDEIQKNKGFEFLGEAVSDESGNYRMSFYDWQYARAERKKADVVVYALDGGEIAGRSRLVNSEDYSDTGLVRDLDVFISQADERTEYEQLMEELDAFLKESKTSLGEIATSADQLRFTAGELDVPRTRIDIAARAELLVKGENKELSHELLYGIGRQGIRLSWAALYKRQEEALQHAIAKSVDERIIRRFQKRKITAFLHEIQDCAVKHVLDYTGVDSGNTLNAMLSNALPTKKQRISFMNALGNFKGSDFSEFWDKHLPAQPEFKDKPGLVSRLLLTQQLTLLTGNHQALVRELQVKKRFRSMHQLFALENADWLDIIKDTGVPDFIVAENEDERAASYAGLIQSLLNAALPTHRIAKMVRNNDLCIEKTRVARSIGAFISKNEEFDFAESRIHDFDEEIKAVSGDSFDEVRGELMKIQRVYQVSTRPEVMPVLMEKKFFSAYSIANVPRKSFVKTYGSALGGERDAFAIHERASHISTRSEMNAVHMMEYSHAVTPAYALGQFEFNEAVAALENKLPNYSELFGRPDLCECEHCRSVYSAAAYFVDLLRYLWRGDPNSDGKSPLEMLTMRRPDLLHLPLTCENTNTLIPYIDLANEVMEYYAAFGSLTSFEGHDTGETTAGELRANPQNFNLQAYRNLKDAKYPFTLPYHQPLDVIRTYSDHLKVSRYDFFKAVNPQPDAITTRAIEAESLRMTQEEYLILSGVAFDGTADTTELHEYFGYSSASDLEKLSGVPEFLQRSGITYTDLVELVKTQFVNPYQSSLDFLQEISSYGSTNANQFYTKLVQIEANVLDPGNDTDILDALNKYNNANDANITAAEFEQWVKAHFSQFQQVITLFEPDSKCDLESTRLRTLQSIYESLPASGITPDTWSKCHRFIRLWQKLGWTIHEVDLLLAALDEDDISAHTIGMLQSVVSLKTSSRRPLSQIAVFWGNMDAYGNKSLYSKLFLNKAVQQIDDAFRADAWGNYLQDGAQNLAAHQSAILAAFRIREEDLSAIVGVAEVIDSGNPRFLDPDTDSLNIENLSTIYRYVVLAKALKMRVTDLCKLVTLYDASPFSRWDIQQKEFTDISPKATDEFYKLAASVKSAGFKSSLLEYILQGSLPADSTLGLDGEKSLQTVKAIRDAFAAIEQDHPQTPASPLTPDILKAKLSLTFQPELVSRFLGIVAGSESFEAITDDNLNVVIPDDLADRYSYINGSGRLTCIGVMSDTEQAILKSLSNVNSNFEAAVDVLYAAPEHFISDNFGGVFSNPGEANAIFLDHPAQGTVASPGERLDYVYERYLPLLKSKLRRDAITQHIAALIGLSQEATSLLIASDMDALITALATEGFSATYFNSIDWTNPALQRTDSTIDFSWGSNAPDSLVSADNFSVRWDARIAAAASGEYTLVVEVEEADDAFNLYLDDTLILEKPPGDPNTSWEVVTSLNAAQMHPLTLEYAETSQNAGIRLYWKAATTGPEIVPSPVVYPATILNEFVVQATIFHRAAKFILGFEISEAELDHYIAYNANFGNIDFKALGMNHWTRIRDFMNLKNSVPQSQALLIDVFALANTPNPAPTTDELRQLLHLATAWGKEDLAFLVDAHFTLGVGDFKNEIAIERIHEVMQISSKTGLSARTIVEWGTAETNFDALHSTAQLIKNTVKANYGEEDWLDLAANLSDKIRKNQQQALVSHLLMQQAIRDAGVNNADALFEFFLIDVQMDACMDTSRIVQANAAIQLFVNRCLLNLESRVDNNLQKGIAPDAIDKDRWEWMKNYRVWEANRKVFLFPENWLEPEWRNDRSEFFRDLESYLVQNDITPRSVDQGFRNYLESLNQVANLEVCGMYHDTDEQMIHVFGRTRSLPHQYFYRTWNKFRKWSAWSKVELDIRSVSDGSRSGVHLIPVVWKKRLFLFWPEILEKVNDLATTNPGSITETEEPEKYWEINLAWSEYIDGKWSPKQISEESITQERYWWRPTHYAEGLGFAIEFRYENRLFIHLVHDAGDGIREWHQDAFFELSDITAKIEASDDGAGWAHESWQQTYDTSYMKVSGYSELQLLDDVYLKTSLGHKLLLSPTVENFSPTFRNPFFFEDSYRSRAYFVRPANKYRFEALKEPSKFRPYIPNLVGDSALPIDIPDFGHEDYLPDTSSGHAYYGRGQTAKSDSGDNFGALTMGDMVTRSSQTSAGSAFSDSHSAAVNPNLLATLPADRGLEFHTFHHPFSSEYVQNLNQGGMSRGNKPADQYPPGLMESDTEIVSDMGSTFEDAYDPNFVQGLVKRHSNFASPPDPRTAYKENVCFDVYGANSLYNWELFFHAPLYVATRLSRNGKYEEAMKWFHYIFDPTTDEMPGPGESEISRYWKVLPFKKFSPGESLEDWFESLLPNNNPGSENAIIGEWRDNPFEPHLVASNRPLAYMKHVVIKYVENLIAWGDSLFRQFTRESVYEALQMYVIANHILGPRPEFVPRRGSIRAESYDSLEYKWDDFSNALVELENIFPYSSEVSTNPNSTGSNMLGIGPALYFCIPANDKLLEYWDTVADRLFKIRHCQDIGGVERQLALFAPPIDPAALIQAVSQGLSLGSILADLSSAPPIYRFSFLMQKANEFCSDVKALGSALLAALEKKDAEELGRLRASHETQILEAVTAIRERQVLDARANKENLLKARDTATFRLQHYNDLLGNEAVVVPAEPTVDATLKADSQLPADTGLATIETDVDGSLADSDETGVKLIPREAEELEQSRIASDFQDAANLTETIASALYFIPQISLGTMPWGVGTMNIVVSGQSIGMAGSAAASGLRALSAMNAYDAERARKLAGYIRREQDWTLQANMAVKEIIQLDKQITSADIRIQVTEKELENHQQQIENAKATELFLKNKFTSQELYQWMKEQLFAVYKQSYNLAFDMAKKTEKAFNYEMGTDKASFIQYGYWDNSKQGLVSGEKLQLSLRQMEKAYLEENRRELELTRSVSLALLNPLALIELKETGKCYLSIPEELFDLDYQGHYFRRIKSVSLSIPCVTGPYASVNCSLRLLKNVLRIDTSMNSEGNYQHENDEGLWIDDDRFRTSNVPVTSIATSTAQNDAGLFEFSFRDERYLPFEGAGAISDWIIELSTEKEFRQFDYSTISDVVMHINYSARENGGLFRENAVAYIKDFIRNSAELSGQPFMRMFSMRHEFPSEWHRFLYPAAESADQMLGFTIGKQRFPFFARDRDLVVMKIEVFAKCTRTGDYHAILSNTDFNGDTVTSSQISMPRNEKYGGLNKATINVNDAGLNLEELDVTGELSLKIKYGTAQDFMSLATKPDEVEDLFLVFHYKMS